MFVLSVSAYATPVMLGGARVRTIPVMVVQQLIDNFQWPFGAALALVLAVATGGGGGGVRVGDGAGGFLTGPGRAVERVQTGLLRAVVFLVYTRF